MFKLKLVSTLLLSACVSIIARDVILEFKGAYFHPTNDCFKDIYGNSAGIFGPELTVQLCNQSNWYGFASVDYLTKSGRSIGLCDKTKVSLSPIAIGLKYFAFSSCNEVADIYLGAGVQPVRVHTKDCSSYVQQNQTRWGAGGIFKVGSYIYAPCNFVLDVFLDYSYARAKGKVTCSPTQNVIPLKANVSGIIFGVGLGYCF